MKTFVKICPLFLLIWLINFSPCSARLTRIIFAGNKAISSSDLRQTVASEMAVDSTLSTSELSARLMEIYQSAGFWNCLVSANTTYDSIGNATLSAAIEEGDLFRFGENKFDGLRHFEADQLISQIGSLNGRIASSAQMQSHFDNLLELYAEAGFPYTTLTATEFGIDSHRGLVTFSIIVNEGPVVILDTLIIKGNKITSDNVIRREFQMFPGSNFSLRNLNSSVARLNRLGFVSVDPPELFFRGEPRQGVLVFNVTENKTSHIDGILGYVPSAGSRKEYLTGMMDIVLDNIMGTGRKAQIYYESTDPKSKEIRFSYSEPYLLGTPLDWTIRFNQMDRDSTFIRVGAEMDFRYRLGPGTDFNLGLAAQRITPGRSDFAPEERYTGYSLALGIDGEYFDYPANPRQGFAFDASARYVKRIFQAAPNYIPLEPEINRTAGEVRSSVALKVSPNSIIFLLGGMAGITGGNEFLPISDRFGIGGRNTVRGYLEGRYYGAIISYLRSEYRLLSGRDGRIYLFSDNGYYYFRDKDGRKVDEILSGFGFGAASKTRLGVVSAEFAWGRGDSFGDGKFHFGIVNRF